VPQHSYFARKSAGKQICFAIACLALAAGYLRFAALEFRAAHSDAGNTTAGIEQAVRLQPSNGEYHARLGRLLEATGDVSDARQQYQAALRLNPHDARYWLDEAGAQERIGNLTEQGRALEHALDVDPRTPEVAWKAANFYLLQGNTDAALRQFHSVLEGNRDMAPAVLDLAWRATHDVNRLVADVLSNDPAPQLALLDTLAGYHETKAAQTVWIHIVSTGRPIELRLALPYINYLIEQREIAAALAAWNQLATVDRVPAYLPSQNLIVNGGFDAEILNAGFDWRYYKQNEVGLSLDETVFHGGHRGLAISFQGPGVDEVKIFQFIPLSPNTTYDFSSYFRTGDLEGAGGPKIVISDAYSPHTYFTSYDLKNAEVWRQINGSFTTGEDAKLAVVKIVRMPEGHPIRGTLWLDDMELTKK